MRKVIWTATIALVMGALVGCNGARTEKRPDAVVTVNEITEVAEVRTAESATAPKSEIKEVSKVETKPTETTETSKSNRMIPEVVAVEKAKHSVVYLKIVKRIQGQNADVIGSGVIIDERGYVVTNNHVAADAVKVTVQTADGKEYPAQVEFTEPAYDLAVVKINSNLKFKALRLGPATDIRDCEKVIAIGCPLGFAHTKTVGHVSNSNVDLTMPNGVVLKKLIQHSAAIDRGNSGGALINLDGELIGINVALYDKARSIGWALNADEVQKILSKKLSAMRQSGINHGLYVRVDARKEITDQSKVMVLDVEAKTPAAEAGLQYGDQLVTVGNYSVTNEFDMERAFWEATGSVTVTVIRKGEPVKVEVKCPTQSARK